MSSISTLRAVANRLNATPIEDLPSQVGFLATSISSCRDLLQNASPNNDHAVILHKLKTRISALLQDRTPEGRFAGIFTAKAIVEAGGVAILSDCGNWIRAIISCLNKSDPTEVKKVAVLAITRMYLLTVDHPAVVRSITIPTLPAFISATLGAIRPSTGTSVGSTIRALSPLLGIVLHSWDVLIEHFASTIRPNVASMKAICLSLVSDDACPGEIQGVAGDVLARLHFCAPKNTITADWYQFCSQIIESAHDTADLVFRAIIEDWASNIPRTSKITKKQKTANVPSTSNSDAAGLDSWSGISQGCSRIVSHITLLRRLFTNSQSSEMRLPIGVLFDLTTRLSAITVPSSTYSPRTNADITREEREELWLHLPRIHTSLLQLHRAMIDTYGQTLFPVSNTIASQTWDIFEAERDHETVREAAYILLGRSLETRLLIISRKDSANLRQLIKQCCEDLMPPNGNGAKETALTNGNIDSKKTNTGGLQFTDLTPSSTRKHTSTDQTQTAVYLAAYNLLPALITHTDIALLEGGSAMRAQLDSTAILVNHYEGILASVLHPFGSQTHGKQQGKRQKPPAPSLLPFLARSAETTSESGAMSNALKLGYEALLRPRMPVVISGAKNTLDVSEFDRTVDDEGENEDEMSIQEDQQQAHSNRILPGISDTNTTFGFPQNDMSARQITTTTTTSPSGTKRDFTTLLEQTTNEQLAASAAVEGLHQPQALVQPPSIVNLTSNREDDPAYKRLRTTEFSIQPSTTITTTIDSSSTTQLPPDSSRSGNGIQQYPHPTDTSPITEGKPDLSAQQDGGNQLSSGLESREGIVGYHVANSHENITTQMGTSGGGDDDDNSDSDSDVPAIDPTLADFSDSDDEDRE